MLHYECAYWERESFFKDIDVAVIGSGIVGLTAALHLKNKMPGAQIAIFERGPLPVGASTRNAGFACFGSMTELLDDLSHTDEDTVLGVVEKRWQGLQRLRALAGDEAIDYQNWGGYEMFNAMEEPVFQTCKARIPEFNDKIGKITGMREVYKIADERIPSLGFSGVEHLILNQPEGQINTGKMMKRLLGLALENGIRMFNGFAVKNIQDGARGVDIETELGWSITVPKLLVCVNGFAAQLLGRRDVWPARNQVLITQPIPNLRIEGCFHYDRGYFYFRNIDNRILLGGGRNLDMETEKSDRFEANEKIRQALLNLLHNTIIPNQTVAVDSWWTGIMGLGPVKKPIIEKVSPNVALGVRLSGMGVAIGTLVGQESAELLL